MRAASFAMTAVSVVFACVLGLSGCDAGGSGTGTTPDVLEDEVEGGVTEDEGYTDDTYEDLPTTRPMIRITQRRPRRARAGLTSQLSQTGRCRLRKFRRSLTTLTRHMAWSSSSSPRAARITGGRVGGISRMRRRSSLETVETPSQSRLTWQRGSIAPLVCIASMQMTRWGLQLWLPRNFDMTTSLLTS